MELRFNDKSIKEIAKDSPYKFLEPDGEIDDLPSDPDEVFRVA